jgi:hypothetical protein
MNLPQTPRQVSGWFFAFNRLSRKLILQKLAGWLKAKFRPARLGGFSGLNSNSVFFETLKKRRNADFLRRHQCFSFKLRLIIGK